MTQTKERIPKPITKKQALFYCEKLWMWLSKHPEAEKYDWTGWPDYNSRFTYYTSSLCPLCDYVHTVNELCDACPMVDRWGIPGSYATRCLDDFSMYYKWERYDTADSAEYAKMIANTAHQLRKEAGWIKK